MAVQQCQCCLLILFLYFFSIGFCIQPTLQVAAILSGCFFKYTEGFKLAMAAHWLLLTATHGILQLDFFQKLPQLLDTPCAAGWGEIALNCFLVHHFLCLASCKVHCQFKVCRQKMSLISRTQHIYTPCYTG